VRSLALVALVLCLAAEAHAQDKQQCADAYTKAQVLRGQQKLRESKKLLTLCAADACPEALRKDCVPWLGEVEKSMPSLVVEASDDSGNVVLGARATVDDEPVLLGRATQLDPGGHSVSVTAPQFAEASKHVTLAAGDTKTLRVPMTHLVASQSNPVQPDVTRVVPVAPIVLATIGAASIGAFIAFGVAGNSIRADLDAENCKPNCPVARVNAIETDYVVADVALGVGIAFAVVATVLFVVLPWHEKAKVALMPAGLSVRF